MRRLSVPLVVLIVPAGCADAGSAAALRGELSAVRAEAEPAPSQAPVRAAEVPAWDVDPAALGEVPCTDEQIAQLGLADEPSAGAITQVASAGGVFEDAIDATAGGFGGTGGFVYARFGANGLEKVALDDESAFDSRDWHIAFRRYVIRLNSGVSGPSKVSAALGAPGTRFDALTAPPPDATFRVEQYYTPSCEFVPDGSGIGGPATALSSFWAYEACLSMTGDVFVVKLPDGRHLKLQVLAYYTTENQKVCDETGEVPQPSGAGNLRVRWAYLD